MAYVLQKGMIVRQVETGDGETAITWNVSVSYDLKRKILSNAIRSIKTDERGEQSVDVDLGTVADIVLSHGVQSWENVTDEAGNALPYSVENARQVDGNTLADLAGKVMSLVYSEKEKN